MASQVRWKLSFVFVTRLLLVSQLLRFLLDLQLQVPTSPMDVVSAPQSLASAKLASQFRWTLSFAFATRLLLVSQLPGLLLVLQLATSPMDVVSASPQILSATLIAGHFLQRKSFARCPLTNL